MYLRPSPDTKNWLRDEKDILRKPKYLSTYYGVGKVILGVEMFIKCAGGLNDS